MGFEPLNPKTPISKIRQLTKWIEKVEKLSHFYGQLMIDTDFSSHYIIYNTSIWNKEQSANLMIFKEEKEKQGSTLAGY